jgi:hypothetical protein
LNVCGALQSTALMSDLRRLGGDVWGQAIPEYRMIRLDTSYDLFERRDTSLKVLDVSRDGS